MAQKSLLFFLLMVVITISGCATAPTQIQVVRASIWQKERSTPAPATTFNPVGCSKGGPKYFDSAKDCESAMQSGECEYYSPSYTGGKGRNPVDGVSKVRVPLEKEACVKMQVVGAIHWVPQKEGSLFRFEKKDDGTIKDVPYAHDGCGNEVTGIVYPQPKKVAVAPPPTPPSNQEEDVCTDNGFVGEQYYPAWTDRGQLACFEKLPWYAWENLRTPVIATVVVGTVVYCATTHRCGDFLRKKSTTSSSTTGTTNPSTSGGPVGIGWFGPIGGRATP